MKIEGAPDWLRYLLSLFHTHRPKKVSSAYVTVFDTSENIRVRNSERDGAVLLERCECGKEYGYLIDRAERLPRDPEYVRMRMSKKGVNPDV